MFDIFTEAVHASCWLFDGFCHFHVICLFYDLSPLRQMMRCQLCRHVITPALACRHTPMLLAFERHFFYFAKRLPFLLSFFFFRLAVFFTPTANIDICRLYDIFTLSCHTPRWRASRWASPATAAIRHTVYVSLLSDGAAAMLIEHAELMPRWGQVAVW